MGVPCPGWAATAPHNGKAVTTTNIRRIPSLFMFIIKILQYYV
jgi:hypothetical protein